MKPTPQSSYLYQLDLNRVRAAEGGAPPLSSSERKFEALMASSELEQISFPEGSLISRAGQVPLDGVLITQGFASVVFNGVSHRLGPGSVIGVAEGLAELPLLHTYHAETAVEARVLPILDIEVAMEKSPPRLRGIFKLSLERILGERFFQVRNGNLFMKNAN